MSDQGSHFINRTVKALIEELQVQHKRSTPYHPNENGTVEAFKKILETALTKVCNAHHLQEAHKADAIQIGIWPRGGYSYGVHHS